ncbi:MAG TPA: hypothetical protein VI451_06885 [Anaerolineales bacterium]|nr:hypothetical protein [Anaerolineales bacterium]
MPEFIFTQENLPTREEFSRILEQGRNSASPLEDLLMLERKLLLFEQKYNLSSSKHFEEYQRGERGDTQDAVNWVGYYRVYLKKNFVTHFQAPVKQAHCISSFAFRMDHFCGSLGIGGEVSRFWGVSGV